MARGKKTQIRDWIGLAGTLAEKVRGASGEQRRAILGRAAAELDRDPDTLRRMLRAYEYLLARSKSEGLGVDEISSSFLALELLERLARTAPQLAVDVARDVLTGHTGYAELQGLARLQSAMKLPEASSAADWGSFVKDLRASFGNMEGELKAAETKSEYTAIAKLLRVDLEFEGDELTAVGFLAPSFNFSEGRGRPLDDHIARAFMALAYYERVYFVVAHDREAERIAFFIDSVSTFFKREMLDRGFHVIRFGMPRGPCS